MAKTRKSKGSSIAVWVAVILAVLLAASVTLSLGAHYGGWFDKDEETEVEDTDTDGSEEDGGSTGTDAAVYALEV